MHLFGVEDTSNALGDNSLILVGASAASRRGTRAGGLGGTAVEIADTAKAGAADGVAISPEVVGGHGVGSESHGREGNGGERELHFEDL